MKLDSIAARHARNVAFAHDVRMEAEKQIKDELFNAAVEIEKKRLLQRRTWWHKVFPYEITFKRRTT